MILSSDMAAKLTQTDETPTDIITTILNEMPDDVRSALLSEEFSEPKYDLLAIIPPEVLLRLISFLGPRELFYFAWTCRNAKILVDNHDHLWQRFLQGETDSTTKNLTDQNNSQQLLVDQQPPQQFLVPPAEVTPSNHHRYMFCVSAAGRHYEFLDCDVKGQKDKRTSAEMHAIFREKLNNDDLINWMYLYHDFYNDPHYMIALFRALAKDKDFTVENLSQISTFFNSLYPLLESHPDKFKYLSAISKKIGSNIIANGLIRTNAFLSSISTLISNQAVPLQKKIIFITKALSDLKHSDDRILIFVFLVAENAQFILMHDEMMNNLGTAIQKYGSEDYPRFMQLLIELEERQLLSPTFMQAICKAILLGKIHHLNNMLNELLSALPNVNPPNENTLEILENLGNVLATRGAFKSIGFIETLFFHPPLTPFRVNENFMKNLWEALGLHGFSAEARDFLIEIAKPETQVLLNNSVFVNRLWNAIKLKDFTHVVTFINHLSQDWAKSLRDNQAFMKIIWEGVDKFGFTHLDKFISVLSNAEAQDFLNNENFITNLGLIFKNHGFEDADKFMSAISHKNAQILLNNREIMSLIWPVLIKYGLKNSQHIINALIEVVLTGDNKYLFENNSLLKSLFQAMLSFGPKNASDIVRKITDKNISSLTKNPLFITKLCQALEQNGCEQIYDFILIAINSDEVRTALENPELIEKIWQTIDSQGASVLEGFISGLLLPTVQPERNDRFIVMLMSICLVCLVVNKERERFFYALIGLVRSISPLLSENNSFINQLFLALETFAKTINITGMNTFTDPVELEKVGVIVEFLDHFSQPSLQKIAKRTELMVVVAQAIKLHGFTNAKSFVLALSQPNAENILNNPYLVKIISNGLIERGFAHADKLVAALSQESAQNILATPILLKYFSTALKIHGFKDADKFISVLSQPQAAPLLKQPGLMRAIGLALENNGFDHAAEFIAAFLNPAALTIVKNKAALMQLMKTIVNKGFAAGIALLEKRVSAKNNPDKENNVANTIDSANLLPLLPPRPNSNAIAPPVGKNPAILFAVSNNQPIRGEESSAVVETLSSNTFKK